MGDGSLGGVVIMACRVVIVVVVVVVVDVVDIVVVGSSNKLSFLDSVGPWKRNQKQIKRPN